jgi:imidazolonepropionase-like amidohydrolase
MRLFLTLLALLVAVPLAAATERFSVLVGGTKVGFMEADTQGATTRIRYDYKNNGRGPTMAETITLGPDGMPIAWTVDGATTFGNKVAERFSTEGGKARWTDSAGRGEAPAGALYVAQHASPWAAGLYARLAGRAGGSLAVLPSGTLKVTPGEMVEAGGQKVRQQTLSGINLEPTTILTDASGALFAFVSPSFLVVREGFEAEDARLRKLAEGWAERRWREIAARVTHRPQGPIRISNVRLFDPKAKALTAPVSVRVEGSRIAAVEAPDASRPGERRFDGEGGTLLPGLFEMHGHLDATDALLDIASGVTSVRDMGNEIEVLEALDRGIREGRLVGPRITKSGFIEGRSPFSSNNGKVVASEAEAVAAVDWYADRGYWQIKIYNSMKPEWVPAVIARAKARGLRVSGHVPAFTTADAMLEAGYDELTHSNQLMLNWVLKPGEDTRTLLRLTALKRLAGYDLSSPAPQRTFNLMQERGVAHDPTLTILEALTTNRNGEVPAGAVDWFDNLPPGAQRASKQALADVSAPGDDEAYRGAWATTLATMRELNRRGVFVVPGTDYGGWLWLHRELELMEKTGMSRADVLARATLDMARYLGQEKELGSIEPGKLADFFLVPGNPLDALKATKFARLVLKDGVIYFPDEIWEEFGIAPLAARATEGK